MSEILIPAIVFTLLMIWIPIIFTFTCHIIMSMITRNRHQRIYIHYTRSNTCFTHTVEHIFLIIVRHINCTYKIVRTILLQSLFQLSVTDVCFVSIIVVRVTMTHESYHTFSSLIGIQCIQYFSSIFHIIHVIQQWSTKFQVHL